VVVAVVALVAASAGWAGEVYRWTDAQGVLHIADVPPPNGHKVQTQNLPDVPPRVVAEAPATPPAPLGAVTPAPSGAATPSTPAAGTPVAGQAEDKGPARVVITEKNEESLGDSQHGRKRRERRADRERVRHAVLRHPAHHAIGVGLELGEIEVAMGIDKHVAHSTGRVGRTRQSNRTRGGASHASPAG